MDETGHQDDSVAGSNRLAIPVLIISVKITLLKGDSRLTAGRIPSLIELEVFGFGRKVDHFNSLPMVQYLESRFAILIHIREVRFKRDFLIEEMAHWAAPRCRDLQCFGVMME